MPATVASLGIDRLARDEKLLLVQEIWNTIAAEPQPPLLTVDQCRELERRIAEDDLTPEDVIPWDEVKAKTVERLQKS